MSNLLDKSKKKKTRIPKTQEGIFDRNSTFSVKPERRIARKKEYRMLRADTEIGEEIFTISKIFNYSSVNELLTDMLEVFKENLTKEEKEFLEMGKKINL